MNIREFKRGDLIVRTQPAKSLGPMIGLMGETIPRGGDRSYMGEKMEFVGIANGQIYINRTDEFESKLFGKRRDLSMDLWEDGWEVWVDPDTLMDDVTYPEPKMSKAEYQAKIDMAIADENYEEAERLRNEMTNNQNK